MRNDLEAARDAFEQGNLALALCLIRSHLRQHKDDGRGWELLGLIQHTRGRAKASVSALERATVLVPLYPAARVSLALGYGSIGKRTLSKELLADLIGDNALTVPLLLQVAGGLDAIDQPGFAARACREASRRDPEQSRPYYDLGYYAARCGQPSHITENLARKAISLDPDNVCYRIGLASHLMRENRIEEGYDVIRHLTNHQIVQIDCQCCVERIVALFESARDYRRVVLCRQHLLALELKGIGSDCD